MLLSVTTRRLAAMTLAVGLLGTGHAALASAKPAASHLSLHSAAASYHVGSPIALTGRALPATKASIALQRLVGTKWVTVAHAKPSTGGAFTVSIKAPSKPVTWQLRAVRGGGTGFKSSTSAVVKTPVVKAIYVVAAHVTVEGNAVSVTGTVTPKASGSVLLQALRGRKWVKLASGKLTKASTFSVTVVRPVGTTTLRVVRAATPAVAGRTGASLHATVTPPTSATPPTSSAPVLTITGTTLPDGIVGIDYSTQLTAVNGAAPYSWTVPAGLLPGGLTLSSAGVFAGLSPTVVSTTFPVTVTDATQATATAVLTVRFNISPSAANTVLSWGHSQYGNLGQSPGTYQKTPSAISGLSGVVATAASDYNGYALRFDGSVWAWGRNDDDQLGVLPNDMTRTAPAAVPGVSHAVAIAAGGAVAMALLSDGTVLAWGNNLDGELGVGTLSLAFRSAPAPVHGLPKIAAIAAGETSAYAVGVDGSVWSWGANGIGQLGNGTATSTTSPAQIPDLSGVVAIDANGPNAVVLKSDGTVWDWGSNFYNAVSADTTLEEQSPVHVPGPTGITHIAQGWFDTYAVAGDGTVWSWGWNDVGEWGNGMAGGQGGPVHLTLAGVLSISAGNKTVCATMTDGSLRTWGSDADKLTGTNGLGDTATPVTPATSGHALGCDVGEYGAYAVVAGS